MDTTDTTSTSCKYVQLADALRAKIATLESGSRLPSVRSLMKRYQLSQQTVHTALQTLENEKLIYRQRGSGVYVSDHRATKLITFHRTRYPCYSTDKKEIQIDNALSAEGWRLNVRHYEIGKEYDPQLSPEPKANAHIIMADVANMHYALFGQILRQRSPIIVLGREMDLRGVDYILSNDSEIFNLLIKHLHSLGHREIGFLINEAMVFEVQRYRQFFTSIMSAMDLSSEHIINCQTKQGEESDLMAYSGLRQYIQERKGKLPFTALIVASAFGATGAIRALHESGLRVPDDCSVAARGHSEDHSHRFHIPAITAAGPRTDAWGSQMAQMLRQRFSGDTSPLLGVHLPVELIARESTGPARPI